MPKPYPKEFRGDVVAVARQGQAPLTQIAKEFGISETCLSNWMKKADIEDGSRPGLTVKDATRLTKTAREMVPVPQTRNARVIGDRGGHG